MLWTSCCVAEALWLQWGDGWEDDDTQCEHTGAEGSCDLSKGHQYQRKSTTLFKFLVICERKTKINLRSFYYLVAILFQVIIFFIGNTTTIFLFII